MPEIVTKRKILPPEKMVADEYRRYLKNGGSNDSLKLRVAAFDRIADKWFKRDETRYKNEA